jgi:DNA (cytosine-5)-methyltransferase 1
MTKNFGAERPSDQPAPTLMFGKGPNDAEWIRDRPATTVLGDPRLAPPGHRDRSPNGQAHHAESIRLSVDQALILQGFPPDLPIAGSKTRQFEQIGNAIPPGLAAAALDELLL